jgi:glyoxylase I family protein
VKIGHIGISVSSVRASSAFYGKHFGLKRAGTYRYKDIGLTIVILKKGSIKLELFEFKKSRSLPQYRKNLDSDMRALGVKHFSLEVAHITGSYNAFKKAKVTLATDIRTFDTGQRYFFIKDPDGILVEIMEAQR